MQRRITTRLIAALTAFVLLGTATGCEEWPLGSHLVTFGAGWLLRDCTMTTTTETVCYRNGEPIDCSELPQ